MSVDKYEGGGERELHALLVDASSPLLPSLQLFFACATLLRLLAMLSQRKTTLLAEFQI